MLTPELKTAFYNKLDADKVKISWNKNPIKMDLFLSFITIATERNYKHLGADNGWTELFNKEHSLIIKGGIVNGTELLDSIQYGIKLSNSYNNYVNPFYLFDILTREGQAFFLEYYAEDIDTIIATEKDGIAIQERRLEKGRRVVQDIEREVELLKEGCKQKEVNNE